MPRRTRVTAAVAGTALVAATAGTAYALWSANGSGTGSVTTATARALTVTGSAVAADLYPGGPAGAVGFTVANPNPYPVTLQGVSYGAPRAGGACGADDVELAAGAPTTVSITVPARGETDGTIPGVVALAADAGDECQGVTLTVDLAFTGSQQ